MNQDSGMVDGHLHRQNNEFYSLKSYINEQIEQKGNKSDNNYVHPQQGEAQIYGQSMKSAENLSCEENDS